MNLQRTGLSAIDMEILYHGLVVLDPGWQSDDARNYYTRLYFVKSGEGYLADATGTVPLKGGNVYLIPSAYAFGFGCKRLEKIFFHVLLPFEEKTDLFSEVGSILVLENCAETVAKLYALYGKEDPLSLLAIKQLLYTVLLRFASEYSLSFSSHPALSQRTTAALAYIRDHASLKLSAEKIAQQLYVSASTLRNDFKRELGIPIGKYVDDAVFFTVQKMLTEGRSIEQIATALGFCDRHYLSRRFKERFGKTISQYRREMRM